MARSHKSSGIYWVYIGVPLFGETIIEGKLWIGLVRTNAGPWGPLGFRKSVPDTPTLYLPSTE